MNFLQEFINYTTNNINQILSLFMDHIRLTALAVIIAILIGVPVGILISYYKKASKPVVGVANLVQAIPSMALLGLSIPLLGIGVLPAITMVVLYSLLPIIKNTYTGVLNINEDTLEAAKAIGLTKFQVLRKKRIPLALPIIMAGVRVSAVTAVGLMTMAGYIGAGGLGFLIFSGISTTNNYQILAGAIPAAILALLVDYIFASIEDLVTPIALQSTSNQSTKQIKRTRNSKKAILAVTSIAILSLFIVTGIKNNANKSDKQITVAGKDFTEQYIMTHMMSELIEDKTDIQVERKVNLGGTQVCFNALDNDEIDIYLDYTGTIYGDTLAYPPISDMDEVYDTSKKDLKEKHNIDVLQQMGFNNTYAIGVSKEVAEKYNLKSISDLAKVSDKLTYGFSLEFLNREDGIIGLKRLYNFETHDVKGLNGANKYLALANGETDVLDVFATDGLVGLYDIVVLEDDKQFFPPYYAVPLVREEILEEYPEIEPLLEELGQALDDETMVGLNYQVDELQRDPATVAKEFLVEEGLID
ncbi:MAG: ABC transporter permease subunit [Clostridiales bacterium]|nr:ABC transporter permease subunit [Clostridiales bacterium]